MKNQRAIEGKNVVIRAFYVNGWYPWACATNISFRSSFERIEKTGPNSGKSKEWELRLGEWGFTLDSVTHIVPAPGIGAHLTIFDALQESIRREGLEMQIAFTDPVGNVKTIQGMCLIPDISIEAGADAFSQDTIEYLGTGDFTMGTVLTPTPENDENTMPYDVLSGSFYGTEGQTSVTVSALIGCKIIEVSRGYPLDFVFSGSPAENEVLIATDTGTKDGFMTSGVLTFGAPLGAGEFIFYIYKKY